MSRIGRKPIEVPKGVEVRIAADRTISVKGPRGQLAWAHPASVAVREEEGKLVVERADDTKRVRSLHGLVRSLVNNMVTGVSEGYTRDLEIVGVGYRAEVQGQKLNLSLGYSHPVEFALPEGITAKLDAKKTKITLEGIDKQKIGQVAADIRSLRKPDAYKGKGIRYAGERIRLKAGKAGKK